MTRVYFIEAVGLNLVKIGHSGDIAERFNSIKTASPAQLRLLGSISGGADVENDLHRRFNSKRIRGEWFRLDDELQRWIERNVITPRRDWPLGPAIDMRVSRRSYVAANAIQKAHESGVSFEPAWPDAGVFIYTTDAADVALLHLSTTLSAGAGLPEIFKSKLDFANRSPVDKRTFFRLKMTKRAVDIAVRDVNIRGRAIIPEQVALWMEDEYADYINSSQSEPWLVAVGGAWLWFQTFGSVTGL